MLTFSIIVWLFSGFFSFLMNLPRIFDFIFVVLKDAGYFSKFVYVFVMFVGHVSAGVISLLATIYHKVTSK